MKSYSVLQRNRSRGSRVWYGRTFENGVLVSERSLKTTNRAEAKRWLDVMNASRFTPASILRGVDDAKPVPMGDAVARYLSQLSGRTLVSYRTPLNILVGWCGRNSVRMVTDMDGDLALKMNSQVEAADSTRRTYLKVMHIFFGWAIDTYQLEMKNPMESVRLPRADTREKSFWTPEQLDMVLSRAPSAEYRLYFALMAFAGLRHFEAQMFGPSMVEGDALHLVGKGGKEALVPISDRLREEMGRVPVSEGMFRGRAYRSDVTAALLRRMAGEAGLPDDGTINNHRLRHSFVSNLVRAGVNAKVVQRLARHSDIGTTMMVYSHVLDKDLVDAVNAKKEGG